jgi:hypothetical protein
MIRAKCLLNNIYRLSSYLTGNAVRLHCKDQSGNGVWGMPVLVVRLITLCRSVPHEVQSLKKLLRLVT